MIAVHTLLPSEPPLRPPLVLIHGAANSAGVWTYWQAMLALRGFASHAIDLRGHGASDAEDLSTTNMSDYTDDAVTFTETLETAPILIGWSMGGLVAMMAAERLGRGHVRACVGLAPSTPARRADASVPLRSGEFDAAEYGITCVDPSDQPAMPDLDRDERVIALASLGRESRYARDERAAGVVIDALPCPLLIVTGTSDTQWPRSRYDDLHFPAEHLSVDDASHWGLVLNRRALPTMLPRIEAWILSPAGIGGQRI